MLQFRTRGFNGSNVKYSPFYDNKLVVSASANYGLVGNGRLYVLSIQNDGQVTSDASFDTQDGLFDVSWSEMHENHCVVASGDGSVKIFDIQVGKFPIMQMKEHTKEVFCVNWNMVDKSQFVSSSWDGLVKVWTPQRAQSLLTLDGVQPNTQSQCIYQAKVSPHNPHIVVSVHSNSHVMVWDTRNGGQRVLDFVGHQGAEALCVDWNKYSSTVIATGGVDKLINMWDLRVQGKNINTLVGHDFAVKNLCWSPHDGNELLSCSYDMSCRVWRTEVGRFQQNRFKAFHGHKEFATGGDYSLWGQPGWVATTGWDEMVYIWDSNRL